MINKKEDLYGTYVKTSDKELLKLYIDKCVNFGFELSPAFSDGKPLDDDFMYVAVGIDGGNVWAVSQMYEVMKNELTIIDLIPQTKEVEWENGDKCIYNDEEFTFVSYMCKPEEDHVVIWRSFDGVKVVYKTQISKPETPEAKKERERDESAKEIMIDLCGDKVFEDRDWDYHKKFTHSAKMAFKLVDLGYRKEN